jgi:hypothetical protein
LTTIFFEATNHLHRWLIATEIHNAPSNAMTRGTSLFPSVSRRAKADG